MVVEFTAVGGPHAGERPAECDARVMSRTATCGEWEDA